MSDVYYVGTDVLLQFLTRSDPEAAERCRVLLMRAANGLVTLEVTVLTVVDLVETLEQQFPREVVASNLPGMLRLPGVLVHERDILLQALRRYADQGISFRLAYQLAHVRSGGNKAIYSFAPEFDQDADIQRLEP